jgi:hypothetical protein
MTTNKHGLELLQDSSLNKSTAFTEVEKQALGIVGLVPDVTETENLQLQRVMMQLAQKNTDLDRYIYLINLLDRLLEIPGIGPVTATALIAAIGGRCGAQEGGS